MSGLHFPLGPSGSVAHMGVLTCPGIVLATLPGIGLIACVLVACCCSLYCCCGVWVQGSALLAKGPSQKKPSHRLYSEEH